MVTLRPLHSIVASITGPENPPTLLLSSAQSPHDYAVKPSELRAIRQADLLVYIGPEFETFLPPLLASINPDNRMEIAQMDAIDWKKLAVPHSHSGHEHAVRDFHFWLNPTLLIPVIRQLQTRLSRLNPPWEMQYHNRADALIEELERLDTKIAAQLADLPSAQYLATHDAYGYFTQHYHLPQATAIQWDPELPASAKQWHEMRRQAKSAHCLMAEPAHYSRWQPIAQRLETPLILADPLGHNIPAGPTHYSQMMQRITTQFTRCFSDIPQNGADK